MRSLIGAFRVWSRSWQLVRAGFQLADNLSRMFPNRGFCVNQGLATGQAKMRPTFAAGAILSSTCDSIAWV
ncbi:MAG: hypothetical protein K9G43_09620, partial [Rhodobacteraceae bacterium]|nr:hypothetical protein [Paracoccaceae bacterium]